MEGSLQLTRRRSPLRAAEIAGIRLRLRCSACWDWDGCCGEQWFFPCRREVGGVVGWWNGEWKKLSRCSRLVAARRRRPSSVRPVRTREAPAPTGDFLDVTAKRQPTCPPRPHRCVIIAQQDLPPGLAFAQTYLNSTSHPPAPPPPQVLQVGIIFGAFAALCAEGSPA
ncbi:uncharacterized protein B0I36DRAFT_139104 [Microdochium trichocladiopsis]|uniref:Uncharacterized protein n=1 Tax=Microdochium trichocladiopsis TaxID=1682393 RepID=A0A9P8Y241_9PEZI|nr:uncharacterized protein B0I36DRAFT_139104 [Microdochium trichocladiopsis]KAH7027483.1 hypothetical protein B0I36DRAFT_139104 [Microdochium trichocladiopsis]